MVIENDLQSVPCTSITGLFMSTKQGRNYKLQTTNCKLQTLSSEK